MNNIFTVFDYRDTKNSFVVVPNSVSHLPRLQSYLYKNVSITIEQVLMYYILVSWILCCMRLYAHKSWLNVNTLRPKQNGRHFSDDMFKCIFLNENVWIPIEISLKFVPKGSINNNPALFQIMAWCRPGDKPLSEPMMVSLPTHICVTRPQWVKR